MTAVMTAPLASVATLADLLDSLGGISPTRVRVRPFPASEADVIAIEAGENRLFELVDGALVEKPMGLRESILAVSIGRMLGNFVSPRKLGIVSGADGMLRLFPGLVRIPDVAYISRERLPGGHLPQEPIPDLVPDLAVEVLSESNTDAEMLRKRREYFSAGVRLLWMIDPQTRTALVFTGVDVFTRFTENESLDGRDVLPGFTLSLHGLFAELDV